MRRAIVYLFFSLFCLFVFFSYASLAAGPTKISYFVDTPSTWTKEDSPYLVQNHVVVRAPLTIEPGTVVKFSSGNPADLTLQNDFYVKGTREEPVVFTSIRDDSYMGDNDDDHGYYKPRVGDWIGLNFNPYQDYALKIEHAKIMYSAFGISIYSSNNHYKNRTVKNCEMKNNGYGILVNNAEPVIENNLIANNQFGIGVNASSKVTKISNNSIFDNEFGAIGSNNANPSLGALDARYNWWGDKSGPNGPDNPNGKGNKVFGKVLFDPWIKEDPLQTPDPVIIIPGIIGSWEKNGKWQIDPIFHTYDDLRSAFLANGYEDGEDEENGGNFFTFPYEWRDSNKVNAVELKAKIQKIKNETNRPKVDIVAHSMGGLLAREYIESTYYQNDIDQLITIGTPHLGAPKDYIKWEGGGWMYDIYEIVGRTIFDHEAQENGFTDSFDYIRNRPILSIKELLPIYNYLYDVNNNYSLRASYPINYPQNDFLENLNKQEKIQMLRNVDFTKIVGKMNVEESTISGYNVVDSNISNFWEHGIPKDFYNPIFVDNGLRYGDGDETVPLYSAEATEIPADKTIYFESEHNTLPTNAQQDILETLTGARPEEKINEWKIDDILIGLVFSPVDIQIISPSGKRLGKDFETGEELNEIEGAYYSGFDTDTEFITIPNPEDGEYKILTQGNGEGGSYKIETTKISENPADPDNAKESSVTIERETQTGEIQEAKVEVVGDQVMYNPDTTPPTISISSPEEKDYTNDKVLTIDYKAEDSESGIASDTWQVEKDGENLNWQEKNINLSFEHLGNYTLKVSATDQARNSNKKEVKFQITTSLDAIKTNINHYFDLGLIKKKIARKYLMIKLRHLENLFNLLEKIQNSKLKPKPKQAAIVALEKIINADIDRIIRRINCKSPQWIDPKAAEFLIEDLNYVRSF